MAESTIYTPANLNESPANLSLLEGDLLEARIAVSKGRLDYFRVTTVNMNPDVRRKQFSQKYLVDVDQKMTLLIESTLKNRYFIARSLIDFSVNVNATGRVRLFGSLIDGVTALWCAAACGHFEIMEYLVKASAIVDKSTKTKSTPLRAACYSGSLQCVKILVEHGAKINRTNTFNSSCLMIASYKGYENIVEYLLSKGANTDAKTNCGFTAMHFAAQSDQINIIKLLISKGAKQFKNNRSLTPILVAAERTHISIVNYLLAELNLTHQEIIDAYELLGASFLNDKDNYNLERGFNGLMTAMKMRCSDQTIEYKKQPYKQVAAYNNQIECETVQALRNIKGYHEELQYEALIIRERLLGENNPDLTPAIIYRGACFADYSNYKPCLRLWSYALQITQDNGFSISDDLLRFNQVFCQMIKTGLDIELSDLTYVLSSAVNEFKLNQKDIATNIGDQQFFEGRMFGNMLSTLGLIIITSIALEKECNLRHPLTKNVIGVIVELNRMNIRSKDNQTLLHLCLSYNINVDNIFTTGICCFPNYLAMKLLIFCGADVNALDNNLDTPLHYIGKFISDFPRLPHDSNNLDTKKMVIELMNGGAHMDFVNKYGVSPYAEYLKKGIFTFVKDTPRALKCLAAVAVKYNIQKDYYCRELPKVLIDFTDLH